MFFPSHFHFVHYIVSFILNHSSFVYMVLYISVWEYHYINVILEISLEWYSFLHSVSQITGYGIRWVQWDVPILIWGFGFAKFVLCLKVYNIQVTNVSEFVILSVKMQILTYSVAFKNIQFWFLNCNTIYINIFLRLWYHIWH